MRGLLAALNDADLERVIRYRSRSGAELQETMYQIVFQMINHATQHRSEVALALTQLGQSPGFLDYAAYVHERAG